MTCHCDLGQIRGRTCHCRTCCLTFSSPSAFDKHIEGWSGSGGAHKRPEDAGLVQVRPGVWGRPGSDPRRALGASS